MNRGDAARLEKYVASGEPAPADFDPYHDRKPYHMAGKMDGKRQRLAALRRSTASPEFEA